MFVFVSTDVARGTWDVGVGSGFITGLRRHPRVPIFRLFIADVVINFESISHPVVRISCVVAFLVYFLIAVTTETTGVSHLSHFGGLVSGLFPAFLFLPNFVREEWEVHLPHVGIAVLLLVLCVFPIVI